MSNLEKAYKLASEWVDSMGGLDNISYIFGDDVSGLVQAFHDEGLLAPDLPGPDVMKLNGDVKCLVCYGVQVRQDTESDDVKVYSKHLLAPTEARRFALALLAACEYAEKEQGNE